MKKKILIAIAVLAGLTAVAVGAIFVIDRTKANELDKIDPYHRIEQNAVRHDENIGIDYIDNIIIVVFKKGVPESRRLEIASSINGTLIVNPFGGDDVKIKIPSKTYSEIEKIVAELEKLDDVDFAMVNTYIQHDINYEPNDPWKEGSKKNKIDWNETYFGDSEEGQNPSFSNWGLRAIQVSSAWEYKDKFEHIKIGVIDNGFDTNHPDLKVTFPYPWMEYLNDKENHGTHVAGIIGANGDNKKGITGIVQNTTLVCADWKATDKQKKNDLVIDDISLLEYCVKDGAKVVNLSFGSSAHLPIGQNSYSKETIDREAHLYSYKMYKLLEEGFDFIVVQSAGNGTSGKNNPSDMKEAKKEEEVFAVNAINNLGFCSISEDNIYIPPESSKTSKQDILDRIIVVGNAKYVNGNFQQAIDSNYGERVDISAPGTNIYSALASWPIYKDKNTDYGYRSGTSMAAPMVTGVCALIWSVKGNNFNGADVKKIVCDPKNTIYTVHDNPDWRHNPTDLSNPRHHEDEQLRLANAKLAVEEAIRRTEEHKNKPPQESQEPVDRHGEASSKEEMKKIYEEYIREKKYTSHIYVEDDMVSLIDKYAILDINCDNIPELILADQLYPHYWFFSYDTERKEVIYIDFRSARYGLEFSKRYNAVVFSGSIYSLHFQSIKKQELIELFNIFYDNIADTHTLNKDKQKTRLSKNMVDEYRNELVSIEFMEISFAPPTSTPVQQTNAGIDIADLWDTRHLDDVEQLLGEPIDVKIAPYGQWIRGSDVNEVKTYFFSHGISVDTYIYNGIESSYIDSLLVDYQQAENKQLFHFDGIDGTSTRDDVVELFGPSVSRLVDQNITFYAYGWNESESVVFGFNSEFNVVSISLSSGL